MTMQIVESTISDDILVRIHIDLLDFSDGIKRAISQAETRALAELDRRASAFTGPWFVDGEIDRSSPSYVKVRFTPMST